MSLADIDPELRAVARMLPRSAGLSRGLGLQRRVFAALGVLGRRRVAAVATAGDHARVRVHGQRGPRRRPVLLWLHGGGYVLGSARQEDAFCRRIAEQAGVVVVAVDYRLAPENPYPAGLEDSYDALLWTARQPWVDPARIAIGGASAGGGLAAALALLARERAEVDPVGPLLTYPMLDDRTGAGPGQPDRLMWSATDNQTAWAWYLGDADPAQAVPARRADLAGLPPTWIGVGELDLFRAEGEEFSRRLTECGVRAEYVEVPGAFHGFDQAVAKASASADFFARQCRFLETVTAEE